MKHIILSTAVLALIFTQCNSQKKTKENSNSTKTKSEMNTSTTSNVVSLKEGETQFFKEYEMNITFSGITEDSRCPTDVNCVWAGVGVAEIGLMGTYTRPFSISLATSDFANKGYQNTTKFNGYTIKLINLSPYPTEQKPSSKLKGEYSIQLQITKDTETNK